MHPKLLELNSEHFVGGEDEEITISGMELTANSFRTVDSPIQIKDLYSVTLSSISATSNTVNSLFQIHYKHAACSLIVSGGSYDSNTLFEGAIFELLESDGFAANEEAPSEFSNGDTFANLYVKSSASFDNN